MFKLGIDEPNQLYYNETCYFPFNRKLAVYLEYRSQNVSDKKLDVQRDRYFFKYQNEKIVYNTKQNIKFKTKKRVGNYEKNKSYYFVNPQEFEWLKEAALDQFYTILIEDPEQLELIAKKIKTTFQEEKIIIPKIEAFNQLENWEMFIELLENLKNSVSKFQTLLFFTAILQYAKLCGYEID